MKSIDINCDMGESYGHFSVGNDKDVMPHISSCNIACGFHGGDPMTIEKTIRMALENGVSIGAHPSYPDLSGFGRRNMQIHHDELKAVLIYQISAIKGMAETLGGVLHHVKPHGALYNTACQDEMVAAIICQCIKDIEPNLKLYGSGQQWRQIAESAGVTFKSEFFADRNYNDDGTLVSRNNGNAIITDIHDSVNHVLNMINTQKVKTINGNMIETMAETVCIHGDHPFAASLAKTLKEELQKEGVLIGST